MKIRQNRSATQIISTIFITLIIVVIGFTVLGEANITDNIANRICFLLVFLLLPIILALIGNSKNEVSGDNIFQFPFAEDILITDHVYSLKDSILLIGRENYYLSRVSENHPKSLDPIYCLFRSSPKEYFIVRYYGDKNVFQEITKERFDKLIAAKNQILEVTQ